jgi:hypothetical protein
VNQPDRPYEEMRDIWNDHNHRQKVEHELIDRKTTWLLTTQAILFAGYGVTFRNQSTSEGLDRFRTVVAWSGLLIAAVILIGVIALIRSKLVSWRAYRDFFGEEGPPDLPRPLDREPLRWGVQSGNTLLALLPDVLLPIIFIGAWAHLI